MSGSSIAARFCVKCGATVYSTEHDCPCRCGAVWAGHPNEHAIDCPVHHGALFVPDARCPDYCGCDLAGRQVDRQHAENCEACCDHHMCLYHVGVEDGYKTAMQDAEKAWRAP